MRVATHHEKSRPLENKAWDQATHFEIFSKYVMKVHRHFFIIETQLEKKYLLITNSGIDFLIC